MQRITAAVFLATASCFLVGNARTASMGPEFSFDIRLEQPSDKAGMLLTLRIGREEAGRYRTEMPGATALKQDYELWRETAEDALRKRLHMA